MNMSRLARLVVSGRRSKFARPRPLARCSSSRSGPLAGKFESAQQNEPSSFLPGDAESVEVLEAADGFPSGQATPAIVVYGDAGRASTRRTRARGRRRGAPRSSPPSIEGVTTVAPPVYSEDGRARSSDGADRCRRRRGGPDRRRRRASASRRRGPAAGARGEGDGSGRLLGRRERGLRGDQLDAALRDRRPRLRPARDHLPQPDLLDPAAASP